MNIEHLGFFFFRGYLKNDMYHYPSGKKKSISKCYNAFNTYKEILYGMQKLMSLQKSYLSLKNPKILQAHASNIFNGFITIIANECRIFQHVSINLI